VEDYSQHFKDLVLLYTKTKMLILRSEQIDPDSASNIAVFKEQRDAGDHLMRVLGTIHLNPPNGEDPDTYVKTHFAKARAHLFRAAFDALDGIGVSCKVLMKQAVDGINNEAITAVYPEYWERIVEFDTLDAQVTGHRNEKDIGKNTLAHLESYSKVIDRLYELTQDFRRRVPQLHEWSEWHLKRVELKNEIAGISNEAITAVFPKYWEKVVELDRLHKELTPQARKPEPSLSGNAGLSQQLDQALIAKHKQYHEIAEEIRRHIPQFHDWESRNKNKEKTDSRKDLKKLAMEYLFFALLGALLCEFLKEPISSWLSHGKATEAKAANLNNITNMPTSRQTPLTNLPSASSSLAPK